MLPNKLSRKTCRSRGTLRPFGAPFISRVAPPLFPSSGEAYPTGVARRGVARRRCRCRRPPFPAAPPCIYSRRVYMPAYIHYADDIRVIRFTSTSLSTFAPPPIPGNYTPPWMLRCSMLVLHHVRREFVPVNERLCYSRLGTIFVHWKDSLIHQYNVRCKILIGWIKLQKRSLKNVYIFIIFNCLHFCNDGFS